MNRTRSRTEALSAAIEAARCAPSVFNTQPWRWRITGDTAELHVDTDRQLRVVDPLAGHVVVGVDGSPAGRAALAFAAGWSDDRRTAAGRRRTTSWPSHPALALLAAELDRPWLWRRAAPAARLGRPRAGGPGRVPGRGHPRAGPRRHSQTGRARPRGTVVQERLRTALGRYGTTQMVIRVGYGQPGFATLRRPAAEVIDPLRRM